MMQNVLSVVIAALIGWGGFTLNLLQQDFAAISVEIQNIKTEVQTLRQLDKERYTTTQATRDWARNEQEISEIKRRLREIERGNR